MTDLAHHRGRRARAWLSTSTDRVAARISRLIPEESRLRPPLRAVRAHLPWVTGPTGARVSTPEPIDSLVQLIAEFARCSDAPVFLQIGANDGDKGDYLQEYVNGGGWRGVLVEPIPYVFAELRRRHGRNPNLQLVNAAIAENDGTAEIFYLPKDDDSALPPWYDAIATFRREVIETHTPWIPDIESRISTMAVPTMTFDSLCASCQVDRIDLVQIDTEGYDFEIVKQVDLDRFKPALILYEHYHLRPGEREACEHHLESHGYRSISNFMDTLSVRIDPDDELSTRLAGLLTELQEGPEHQGR